MMVLTARPPPAGPASETSDRLPPRVSVKPPGPRTGLLDGAWWPRSRDLSAELPGLTGLLEPRWGRITRVTVNPTHWAEVPRKIPVDDRVVKVGWFLEEQDPDQLLLFSYHVGRYDLLIIPPETDPTAAERLMAAACDPRTFRTGSQLIADEGARRPGRTGGATVMGHIQKERWETDGGAIAAPLTPQPSER